MIDSNLDYSVCATDSDKNLFVARPMKEVVEDVYGLHGEYWTLGIYGHRHEDDTWYFPSYKWSGSESVITAFSETSAHERDLRERLKVNEIWKTMLKTKKLKSSV